MTSMPNVTKHDIPRIATCALEGSLDDSGAFLYSGHHTIQPGKIYLLGLNPGGGDGPLLRDCIGGLLNQEKNAYIDEIWERQSVAGQAPLQKRIAWILSNMGVEPTDVFASNLIFMRSRDATGVSIEHANQCWPVHEALLSIVRPRIILAFGNSGFSPYGYIHSLYGGEQRFAQSGHGSWLLKGFDVQMAWGKVFVAGLPHLSRYDPIGKQFVIDWLKNGIRY